LKTCIGWAAAADLRSNHGNATSMFRYGEIDAAGAASGEADVFCRSARGMVHLAVQVISWSACS